MGDEKAVSCAGSVAGVGAAKWNKSGPVCVLKNESMTDRGRVGREGAVLPWCQTWQWGMGNSLPAWTPSLLQGMFPTVELVSSPWEHRRRKTGEQ